MRIGLFILALAVRIIAIEATGAGQIRFGDAGDYIETARSICEKQVYPERGNLPFFRPPGLPFFIAGVTACDPSRIRLMKYALAAVDAGTVLVIFELALLVGLSSCQGVRGSGCPVPTRQPGNPKTRHPNEPRQLENHHHRPRIHRRQRVLDRPRPRRLAERRRGDEKRQTRRPEERQIAPLGIRLIRADRLRRIDVIRRVAEADRGRARGLDRDDPDRQGRDEKANSYRV